MSRELKERNGRRNPVASVVNAKEDGSCGLVYSAIAPSADVGVAKLNQSDFPARASLYKRQF